MPRRQAHCTVNRNKRVVGGLASSSVLPINTSTPTSDDRSIYELEGRLTLVQERTFDFVVKHDIADRDAYDYEGSADKVNQTGALHSDCIPIVTNNDPSSYFAAVNKRSNFIQKDSADDIGDAEFREALALIQQLPDLFDTEWDENDEDRAYWLSRFDHGKQKRMEEAWASRDMTDLKELRRKTGSVKIESLNGKRFDKTAAGRIIYAGSDMFNAVTGPAQMVMMQRLVQLLGSSTSTGPTTLGDVQFMLGYKTNDIALASFIRDDRFREIVEGDFSRNDREQRSRVALLCDAWCDKLKIPQWYRDLLLALEKYTLTNREFGLRVHLMYQLATGTTNTTFRNSIYNMTMFAVACKRQGRRGKALVLGDDLLAALNKRFKLDDWIKTVAAFKMVLKAKAVDLDSDATFLSRFIFADVETPFMIPLLGKMLVRFNTRACQNPLLSDSAAMAAKALSYAFGCKNCHVLRDIFLQRFEMEEDANEFDVDALGWLARSNGYKVEDIKRIVRDAPNLIDDDQFSYACSKRYDLDICEVLELFEATILNTDLEILELANIEKMRKDYE